MYLACLIKRSLVFYWRTALAVLIAAMVGTAVLSGALFVGDSVRGSLSMIVEQRLGKTELVLSTGSEFFTTELAGRVSSELNSPAAAVIALHGVAVNADGTRRANNVRIYGVDDDFFAMGEAKVIEDWSGQVVLNMALANKLLLESTDEIVLRIVKPGVLPLDTALTASGENSISFRLPVKAIATEKEFGRFGLESNQQWPLNIFVPRSWLEEKLELTGHANLLLLGSGDTNDIKTEDVDSAVKKAWTIADVGLGFKANEKRSVIELASRRVFIDDDIFRKAKGLSPKATGILTYFVNEIKSDTDSCPYSMVAAIDDNVKLGGFPASQLADDEIIINRWLADDIKAQSGDVIELSYFVLSSDGKLDEHRKKFTVREVVEIEGLAADQTLMPDFPGLKDVENCRQWEPGVPVDLDKIRDVDEKYWEDYRGTPKAFISLKTGQQMWSNRYGSVTAVRYPASQFGTEQLSNSLKDMINPRSEGLFFSDVRQRGLKASSEGTDFGQLFAGLSMFLIGSALVLTGLLFVFGVQRRTNQAGILLAGGFNEATVHGLFIWEGMVLAIAGSGLGLVLGLAYTKAVIRLLTTIWADAVSGSELGFYVTVKSCVISVVAGILMATASIWYAGRKELRKSIRELLDGSRQGQFDISSPAGSGKLAYILLVITLVSALLLIAAGLIDDSMKVGAFFGGGALLLLSGIIVARLKITGSQRKFSSIASLASANAQSRPGRSLAVVTLLALGVFMVVGVGSNRRDPLAGAEKRGSGTGGFILMAQSSAVITKDLNLEPVQREYRFFEDELKGVNFVSIRVRDGEDASCFNLNRVQKPQLLSVKPAELESRGAFSFTNIMFSENSGWDVLEEKLGDDAIPAIGDEATVIWGLGKSPGDEIEYVDDSGRSFRVRIVGVINNSILQGNLIISDKNFRERFSNEQGYRMFLIDTQPGQGSEVLELLTERMSDKGFEVTTTAEKLAAFSSVENTYLTVFQVLGGFGIILGSFGLGVVVLRNVLDRRGELAMLWALGFEKATLKRIILREHFGLVLMGFLIGVVTAAVAVMPVLISSAQRVPFISLGLTIIMIAISGLFWIWLAGSVALKGDLLEGLRNE